MAANIFNAIRKSYITHVFFTSILSNLVVFGQPLQQIVQDYCNHEEQQTNYRKGYYNNLSNPENDAERHTDVTTKEPEKTLEMTNIFFAAEKQGIIGKSSESEGEDVIDNIFSISLPENIDAKNYDAVLTYDLYGLSNASQTTKSINNHMSYGGKVVVKTNSWTSVQEVIATNQLKPGSNEIFFNRRANETYQYKISNVRIELKERKKGDIHLTESLTNLDGSLYLVGTVTNPAITEVSVMGYTVAVNNGVFEQVLVNVPKKTKSLEISYKGAGDKPYAIKFPIQYESKEVSYQFTEETYNSAGETYTINDLVSQCITYKALGISAEGNYNKEAIGRIVVQGLLFKDVKSLDADLKNVTAGNFKAYRIKKVNLPDSVAVQLHVKYDPEMIPDGYTAQDIRTFYFDKNQRNWKALPVDSLDYTNKEIITSIYNNETDFINGVIKVPESPETGSFAPTTISDMKYADPTAGVVSIAPPTPNSTGTASTSFPIKLPQGRNGMQPSLAVTYNSEAGNGWMGIGWNLSTPAITVNTKWGVPVFGEKETEIYSLNGEDMVFKESGNYGAPHRVANVVRGTADKTFYLRKEGSYQKIIRHGSGPSAYWWEVTDKQGNKSFYGGYTGAGIVETAVIRAGDNIAHWGLVRTQDPYGNYVDYTYNDNNTVQQNPNLPNTTIAAKEFYLTKIRYTMRSGVANYYEVEFKRNAYTVAGPGQTTTFNPRKDVIINARNGYLQLTDELLTEIHVSFMQGSASRIRTYRFDYADAPFDKKQLSSIAEFDTNGQLFYSNTLEYYNDIGSDNIISTTGTTWGSAEGDEDISSVLNTLTGDTGIIPNGSPLGTSVSDGFSIALRGGLGIGYNAMNVNTTLGGSVSYSQNKQDTRISLIDINGDGLPDKVYKDSDGVKYRPNITNGFGSLISVDGISELSKTKSQTFGHGFDANALGLLGVGKSWSTTKSETENYFTDFNGDGLPDIATGGRVRFNTTASGEDYTHRDFDLSVNGSENVIIPGAVDPSIVPYLRLPTMTQLRAEHPQFDHVKVWQAPYEGSVSITGTAILRQLNAANGHTNSYKVKTERAHAGSTGFTTVLNTGHLLTIGERNMNNNIFVEKGDLIFFRIHNPDFGYGGEVEWNPSIKYNFITSWLPDAAAIIDENGKQLNTYNAQSDFILNNDGGMAAHNSDQNLTIKFNLLNFTTQLSDNVTFKIKQVQTNLNDGTEAILDIWERTYDHESGTWLSGSDPESFSPGLSSGIYKDDFYFYVESTSNVDWGAINWKPQMVGNFSGTRYPGVNYKTYDDNMNQRKYWIDYNQIPSPVINYAYEEDDPFMVVRHTFNDQDYSPYMDDFEDSEFPLKASWVVKEQMGSGIATTLHRRTVYIYKTSTGYKLTKSINENDLLLTTHTDFYKYILDKKQIKDLQNGNGRIFSGLYLEDRRLGIDNISSIIFELAPGEVPNYPSFEVILDKPIMAGNANFYGNAYRGWGQFLYNGGLGFEYDEEGNVTTTPPVLYGDSAIDMSVFKTEANAEELQAIDYNQQPTSSMGETVIRYTFYNQQNPDSKYVNKAIKGSQYGYNANLQLTVRTGRFGEENLYDLYVDPATITAGGSGIFVGMRQRSESKGNAESANFLDFNGTQSEGGSEVLNMHMDLNGDRYPDVVSGSIQYTNMLGGLSNIVKVSDFYVGDESKDKTVGVPISGMPPNSSDSANEDTTGNRTVTNAKSGINDSDGSSFNSRQWVDMNGDGLPDKVLITGGNVTVYLNKGYGFTDPIIWASGVQDVISNRYSGGVGISANFGSSFAAGFGGAASTANMNVMLFDVNGDGLPDFVFNAGSSYNYYLNTGKDFATLQPKVFYGSSTMEQDYSVSGNMFGSFTGGFPIPTPIPGVAIKVTYTPTAGANANFNEKRGTIQDLNGDGQVDVILKGSAINNNSINANFNKIGKTHLLKKVNSPLGGSWTIEYAANTKSYDMPSHKWLLNKIYTHDGFEGDVSLRPDRTYREISYRLPKYDRREREFLGYGEMTVLEKDAANPTGPAFRKAVTQYHNENYYLSGAKKQTYLYNQQDQLLAQETTLYNLLNPDAPVVNLNATEDDHNLQVSLASSANIYIDKSRLFIAVVRISSSSYEGGQGLTAVKEFTEYDASGNIKEYVDYGGGPEDAYKSKIEYYTAMGSLENAVGFAKKITVLKKSNNQLLRQREAEYNSLGKLSKVITKLNSTENNNVTFAYDVYGNLTQVKQLENLNALGALPYEQNISYDNVVFTYPTGFTNSFQEASSTVYDYKFGVPVLTTDMNLQRMRTRIDDRGRVVEVTGPNEMFLENNLGNGSTWTMRMQYKGEALLAGNIPATTYVIDATKSFAAVAPGAGQPTASQHYAVTRHYDPEFNAPLDTNFNSTNQFVTISIVDGFGQAIQVKKNHWSKTNPTASLANKWLVSGFEAKDAFGRVVRTYLPVVQDYGGNPNNLSSTDTAYLNATTLSSPTIMTYDERDRIRTIKQPGETQMFTTSYNISDGMFYQASANELGQSTITFTDIRGRQRRVIQNNTLGTTFDYNAINELVKITNHNGFMTNYVYDLAGRKTEVQHPDRGVQMFKYDKSGNMIEQGNSNIMLASGTMIKYSYDYNRLIKVEYPQNPQNNVAYTYGKVSGDNLAESNNARGRLLYQEDASGVQVFGYGRMGEVTKNLRSVAVAGYQSFWFLTLWKYDSWNRVQEITYSDQEVVKYDYNNAGMLNKVYTSNMPISPSETIQDVVKSITYNDLGERAEIVYGNNTKTTYGYDVRRRMNLLGHSFSNMQVNNAYTYDAISNIKTIITQQPQTSLPATNNIGGPVMHSYQYDNFNRLTNAVGSYIGSGDESTPYLQQNYELKMEYNNSHTIKRKELTHTQGLTSSVGGSVTAVRPVQKTSYILDYQAYGTGAYVTATNTADYGYQQPHAPRKIVESPNWDNASDQYIKSKEIKYDANGNQTEIKQKMGNTMISLRKNMWDEENRLMGVDLKPDDVSKHPIAVYTYDAGGERIVKYNLTHIDVFSNAEEVGELRKDNIMIYPSGLVMGKVIHTANPAKNEVVYTKHYYIGAERISAKTATTKTLGNYPLSWLANSNVMPALNETSTKALSNQAEGDALSYVPAVYTYFGAEAPALSNIPAVNNVDTRHTGPVDYYYFHKDHLGSSSYVTNGAGKVTQHMEYMPFGETLVDEHLNSYNTPFKFNGKEFDEETGNYYYGARYYDPKWSIFISVDPLAEKYPNWSSYAYCFNNPTRYIDPTGMESDDVIVKGKEAEKAFEELQKSVGKEIHLTKDSNGKLGYTKGEGKISKDTQQLINAIDDHSVVVNVTAEDNYIASNGGFYLGGAFMGNNITQNTDSQSGKTIVEAFQEINPNVLSKADTYHESPGSLTLHEVTESYHGALLAREAGVSVGPATAADKNNKNSIYTKAHVAATNQNMPVKGYYYNSSGRIVPVDSPELHHAEFRTFKGKRPELIILSIP